MFYKIKRSLSKNEFLINFFHPVVVMFNKKITALQTFLRQ